MKRILKSLLVLSAAVAVMVGVTSAVWTAQTKVLNPSSFKTGNADLQIWDAGQTSGWKEQINGPSFDDIYPTWTQDYSLKVKNNGSTNLMLSLEGKGESGWSDSCFLRDEIVVHVWKFNDANGDYHWNAGEGTADLEEKTLEAWRTSPLAAGQLDAGDKQWFLLRFRVGDLGDTKQGCTMSGYSFIFDGTTAGATQPTPSPLP